MDKKTIVIYSDIFFKVRINPSSGYRNSHSPDVIIKSKKPCFLLGESEDDFSADY
jgi:hypothetical protein